MNSTGSDWVHAATTQWADIASDLRTSIICMTIWPVTDIPKLSPKQRVLKRIGPRLSEVRSNVVFEAGDPCPKNVGELEYKSQPRLSIFGLVGYFWVSTKVEGKTKVQQLKSLGPQITTLKIWIKRSLIRWAFETGNVYNFGTDG